MNEILKTKIGRILLIIILVGMILLANLFFKLALIKQHLPLLTIPDQYSALQLESGETHVDKSFNTHLPLVIIDTAVDRPKHGTIWDIEKGYSVKVEFDPYAYGTIAIIDNKEGLNSITDDPTFLSNVKLRIRGTSSAGYPKKQYLVKLIDDEGNNNPQNVFNMGVDNEWILNVSWQDPSLLRNYLAYTIAPSLGLSAPQVKFCEVVYKDNDSYEYLGVYLWIEKIGRDQFKEEIPRYRASQSPSFLIQRDRFSEDAIILDNYSTRNELASGFLELIYPNSTSISQTDIDQLTQVIDNFEEKLYALDSDDFIKYRQYIDFKTFVDYFIFNEFLMNYDAGRFSTYFYKGYTGLINMGPVWDYDRSLANDPTFVGNMYATALQSSPWCEQLLRDPSYVTAIVDRYHDLRENVLSEEEIFLMIDNAYEYLDTAAERDWNRWQYDQTITKRASFALPTILEQESINLKTTIIKHGIWLDKNIDSLYQFSDSSINFVHPDVLYRKQADIYSEFLAVIFIAAVVISAILLQRES